MAKEKTTEQKDALQSDAALDVRSLIKGEVAATMAGVMDQISKAFASKQTGLDQLAAAYIESVKHSRLAVKNATNPHLKNTYADLGAVLDAVRDAFLSNDLWLMQSPGFITIKEGQPYGELSGVLLHKSGQSVNLKMELPAFTLSKTGTVVINPQTAASAISYARRYMWLAVAGITQVDDDADAASYMDQAEGPQNSTPQTDSTPSKNLCAELIEQIEATKDKPALVALRAEALATKDNKVKAAYMKMYEQHNGQQ